MKASSLGDVEELGRSNLLDHHSFSIASMCVCRTKDRIQRWSTKQKLISVCSTEHAR